MVRQWILLHILDCSVSSAKVEIKSSKGKSMIELFSIGSFGIYLLSVTTAIGIAAGLWIMLKEGKRKELDHEKLLDLGTYTVIAGIIGARLGYVVAFNPMYYLQNPMEIFMIHKGGLSIQGAIIVAGVVSFGYMKKKRMLMWKTADAFAPGIILGQAIGRIGCDVFGTPMVRDLLWGVSVNGQLLHPVQIYEVLLNYLLFLILWKKRKSIDYDGQLFIWYLIGFSINRFIVEFFRVNPLIIGSLSVAHMISLMIIVLTILVMIWLKNKQDSAISYSQNELNHIKETQSGIYYLIGVSAIISIVFYYWIHFYFAAVH